MNSFGLVRPVQSSASAFSYFAGSERISILEGRNARENLYVKVAHRVNDPAVAAQVNAALRLLLHRRVERTGILELNQGMIGREL
jgi:hypothetical protein